MEGRKCRFAFDVMMSVRHEAAAKIQSGARRYLSLRKFRESKAAVIVVQRAYRDLQAKRYGKRLLEAKKRLNKQAKSRQWEKQKQVVKLRRLGSKSKPSDAKPAQAKLQF